MQAAYTRALSDWTAQMAAMRAQAAQLTAQQRAALQNQTAPLVQQLAEDLVQNRTAWERSASQLQVQTYQPSCKVIIHPPVFTPGKFDPGGCDAPTLQPGTPPSYTPGTPGTWCARGAGLATPACVLCGVLAAVL